MKKVALITQYDQMYSSVETSQRALCPFCLFNRLSNNLTKAYHRIVTHMLCLNGVAKPCLCNTAFYVAPRFYVDVLPLTFHRGGRAFPPLAGYIRLL